MSSLFICVVIPCLNEEQTLGATCRSLGFGYGSEALPNAALILVDNGSTDSTRLIAQEVRNTSPSGSVVLTEELERGYVPPRCRGNLVATELSFKRGFSKENTLLVQADADTTYNASYLDAFRASALANGQGTMLNACMGWPPDFVEQYPNYIALCDEVDDEFASLLTDQPDDVVVDDKACAYRASDYEHWGGHQREFSSRGDEIFSETTRLYLRARAFGARRSLCDDALAHHSARRILSEPALSFATAGFPRGASFCAAWQNAYCGPNTLTDFTEIAGRPQIALAVLARRAHLWGLFGLLPAHVARALGQERLQSEEISKAAMSLPQRSPETVRENPAVLLEDVFYPIDRRVFDSSSMSSVAAGE